MNEFVTFTHRSTRAAAGDGPPTSRTRCFGLSKSGNQVISENPASRGTETSAEVLVGPPWRMVSNAGREEEQSEYLLYCI